MSGVVIRACRYPEFHMSEEGLRNLPYVVVYYGFNNYRKTMYQLNEIADVIRQETKYVDVYDMEVYEITRVQSSRYAGHTMIYCKLTIDTFLKLRSENKLNVL